MRKAQAKKLPLAPDPKFNDKLVTRFVNNLMWEGKKSGAYTIFYDALDKVTKQTSEDGYEVWKRALANVTPGVEVRSRRSMSDKLAGEIVAASKGEGAAFKKKEDTHRMAEANKAFAHFRI